MFLDELSPLFKDMMQSPIAFMGGLASGLLRLNLDQDPVKSWLEKQGAAVPSASDSDPNDKNGGAGPTSISID
ncbi:MAG: hypothetical protein HC824_04480 [Synechococcales cyanobacterium RM1_1_8]|nr:hypothetical protein [Synechococcales cyanobacterium RM1_1_8]